MPSAPNPSDAPNALATTQDFEFAALFEAHNYRQSLKVEFSPYLRGTVVEIGAGIGQMTSAFKSLPLIDELICVEPDPGFCREHRKHHPGHRLIEGLIDDLPANAKPDAIVSINVLEHIGPDAEELAKYQRLLAPQGGRLCLFVPARPEIYAPIDKDFGHFRRYTRPELTGKLERAGFEVETCCYYNLPGYVAWWVSFCLLKQRAFSVKNVRLFDRVIFPVVHAVESHLWRPPIGQSLLAVAKAR